MKDLQLPRFVISIRLPATPKKPVLTQPKAAPPLPALEGDAMLASLAAVFTSTLPAESDRSKITHFHAVRKPGMALDGYLKRLRDHFICSDSCILTAMIYIDRIMTGSEETIVNQLSIHRFLATSLMVSVKFHDDTYYTNTYYAKGIGVSLRELNVLEAEFLKALKWRLHVSPEEYFHYEQLLATSARKLR
jgi:hypothetical protein